MNRGAVAFVGGALFSAGLCLSGMTQPSKVIGFLDFTGKWDPTLAFVMVGAIAVTVIAFRVAARRAAPVLDARFHLPDVRKAVDARLVVGAAVFGAGWGLGGLCPGPAVASLASGQVGALVFVAAMLGGMGLHRLYDRSTARAKAPTADAPAAE